MNPRLQQTTAALRSRWARLTARERRIATIVLVMIGALLLWLLALGPAWQATRTLPAELQRLDGQWQQMQRLAAESRALRGAPAVAAGQSVATLRTSTQGLGDGAKLLLVGDRATLTLTDTPGDELRDWLQQAREGAHARPVEVKLTRNPQGNFAGTVVVVLPGAAP
jgi:general secretion pathway protein M